MQRVGLMETAEGLVPTDLELFERVNVIRRDAREVPDKTPCEYIGRCKILKTRKGEACGKLVIGQCEYPFVDRCAYWLSRKIKKGGTNLWQD